MGNFGESLFYREHVLLRVKRAIMSEVEAALIVIETRERTGGYEAALVAYAVEMDDTPRLGKIIASLVICKRETQLGITHLALDMMRKMIGEDYKLILCPRWDNVVKWLDGTFRANLDGSKMIRQLGIEGHAAIRFPVALEGKWVSAPTIRRGLNKFLDFTRLTVKLNKGDKKHKRFIDTYSWVNSFEEENEAEEEEETEKENGVGDKGFDDDDKEDY